MAAVMAGVLMAGALGTTGAFAGRAHATTTLQGVTFVDADNDGVFNPDIESGDLLLPGVTVTIYNANGPVGAVASGVGGQWTFTAQAAGPFRIEYSGNPANSYQGFQMGGSNVQFTDGSGAQKYTLFGGADETGTLRDFAGHGKPTQIGNYLWLDANSNGIQDPGEAPMPNGIVVDLLDAAGSLVQQAAVFNGIYNFSGLPPSTPKTIRIDLTNPTNAALLADYTLTVANSTANGGTDRSDSDAVQSGTSYIIGAMTPAVGANNDFDFGFILKPVVTTTTTEATTTTTLPATHSIGNTVFQDTDRDGLLEGGEPRFAGITVTLRDANGVERTTTTDANGNYRFDNVVDGTYTVTFAAPIGWVFSPIADGDDNNKANAAGQVTITVAGTDNMLADAGLNQPVVTTTSSTTTQPGRYAIGNTVFQDSDRDGTLDSGEAPFANVTVTLRDAAGNVLGTTRTDDAGHYQFTNLLNGTYLVTFDAPTGWVFSPIASGDDNNKANAAGQVTITVTNANNMLADAGLNQPVVTTTTPTTTQPARYSLGNLVFVDANDNGRRDSGEAAFPGIIVTLRNAAGTVLATRTTNADGEYLFPNLPDGTYTVDFAVPTGWDVSSTAPGGNDNNNANTAGRATGTISGANNLTVDAGLHQPIVTTTTTTQPARYSLGNLVFVDANDNGHRDSGEAAFPGIIVTLRNAAGTVLATRTTNADGEYLFPNLPDGTYTVDFAVPTGWDVSSTAPGGNDNNNANTAGRATGTISGANNLTVDAGLHQPIVTTTTTTQPARYAIGNTVFQDADGDGVYDSGESPFANVVVTLRDASGNVVGTTRTNGEGRYRFTNLPNGTYTVEFDAPSGWVFSPIAAGDDNNKANTAGRVTVTVTNADNMTADAGLNQPIVTTTTIPRYSLGDYVFQDTNNNGQHDSGEQVFPGVRVTLRDAAGNILATDTTDGDGEYLFPNLVNGTYTVDFTVPNGWAISSTAPGGNNANNANAAGRATGVINGANNLTVDAGLRRALYSLGNFVFHDTNDDGIHQSGEAPYAGITVTLFDSTGVELAHVVTGSDGGYAFNGLPDGDYRVEFQIPAGERISSSTQPGDNNNKAGANGTLIARIAGANNMLADAGLHRPRTYSLGNYVFQDTNNTGTHDSGEPGFGGVTVTLRNAAGVVIDSQITDSSGGYLFTNLANGTYTVDVTAPEGWLISSTAPGGNNNNNADSNGRMSGAINNANNLTVDAGLRRAPAATYSLGDVLFYDLNANGVRDADENGVPGQRVELWQNDAMVAFTTTDAAGAYHFSGLLPGTYQVRFTAPAGHVFSPITSGGNNANNANPSGQATGTILNADNNSVDAGVRPQTYALGDLVFVDSNGNGVRDSGEPAMSGIRVTVRNAAGTVVGTAVTDTNGSWTVDNLPAGSYTVNFEAPDGYHWSAVTSGGNNANNANASGNATGTITTANNLAVDAGLVRDQPRTYTIGDRVWRDTNGNGIQDAGEPGIAGATVTVVDDATHLTYTTTTDANGAWSISNLPNGTYTVTFSAPSGMVPTTPGAGSDRGADSNPNASGVTTVTVNNADDRTIDAGYVTPPANTYRIGDRVWADANGNGIQDTGELGVAGATVTVYNAAGQAVGSAVTDSNGYWSVSGLPNGSYTVRFTAPSGYSFTTPLAGSDRGLDSDAGSNGVTGTITVSGADVLTVDAGLVGTPVVTTIVIVTTTTSPTASTTTTTTAPAGICIGDKVFVAPTPGAKDGAGLSGITVTLIRPDGTTMTTVTDASGRYQFCGLPATGGTYTVKVTAPRDMVATYNLDANVNDETTINLPASQSNSDVDFGYIAKPIVTVEPTSIVATTVPAPEVAQVTYTGSNTTRDALWGFSLLLIGLGLVGMFTDRRRQLAAAY